MNALMALQIYAIGSVLTPEKAGWVVPAVSAAARARGAAAAMALGPVLDGGPVLAVHNRHLGPVLRKGRFYRCRKPVFHLGPVLAATERGGEGRIGEKLSA